MLSLFVSDLSGTQVHTAGRVHGASAGVRLTRVSWNTDKSVAVVSRLADALELSRTGYKTTRVLVTRRVRRRTAIDYCIHSVASIFNNNTGVLSTPSDPTKQSVASGRAVRIWHNSTTVTGEHDADHMDLVGYNMTLIATNLCY